MNEGEIYALDHLINVFSFQHRKITCGLLKTKTIEIYFSFRQCPLYLLKRDWFLLGEVFHLGGHFAQYIQYIVYLAEHAALVMPIRIYLFVTRFSSQSAQCTLLYFKIRMYLYIRIWKHLYFIFHFISNQTAEVANSN